MQWLQYPSKINGDKRNNVGCETKNLRNKKREFLRDKINGLPTNSNKKNIRDQYGERNESERAYQPGCKLAKD
jgi:hypothetical protein